MLFRRHLVESIVLAGALTACGGSDGSADPAPNDTGAASIDTTTSDDSSGATDTSSSDSFGASDSSVAFDSSPDTAETGAATDYAAVGPFAVVKGDGTVSGRAVHWFAPAGAAPADGFSAVVFAHGFLLKPTDYDEVLSHVASWGFVVVSTDFPGSLFSIDHRDVAKALIAARASLLDGTLASVPKVASKRVAASGHSLGGKGAVMAALAEPAFAAVLALDPVDGNPGNPLGGGPDAAHPALIPSETAKLVVPVGYFGATQSHCVKPPAFPGAPASACAPEKLDAAAFFAGTPSTTTRYLWTAFDFGHMQFLDNPKCGTACDACVAGKSSGTAQRTAIAAISTAFLKRRLDGDASAETWLSGAKRDVAIAAGALWDGIAPRPACP